MKPRRTPSSNQVLRLDGGNEDNDLWVCVDEDDDGSTMIGSVWVPTDEERRALADGANVKLLVWGRGHPPVAMLVTRETIGRAAPVK